MPSERSRVRNRGSATGCRKRGAQLVAVRLRRLLRRLLLELTHDPFASGVEVWADRVIGDDPARYQAEVEPQSAFQDRRGLVPVRRLLSFCCQCHVLLASRIAIGANDGRDNIGRPRLTPLRRSITLRRDKGQRSANCLARGHER